MIYQLQGVAPFICDKAEIQRVLTCKSFWEENALKLSPRNLCDGVGDAGCPGAPLPQHCSYTRTCQACQTAGHDTAAKFSGSHQCRTKHALYLLRLQVARASFLTLPSITIPLLYFPFSFCSAGKSCIWTALMALL